MKKGLFLVILCLCTASVFISCRDTNIPGHSDESTAETGENQTQNNTSTGIEGVRIWDWYHPGDSGRNPAWAVTFASMPGIEFKRGEAGAVFINDELLIGGPGYGCMSFYKAKLSGTDKTVLCFGMSCGSGICDERIVIIDPETRQEIFTLCDRMNYDYRLFVRDGLLCVRELKYMTEEVTRTGLLTYEGGAFRIVWDDFENCKEDRDIVSEGQPIS